MLSRKTILASASVIALVLASTLEAQGIGDYLPAAYAGKAARLLSTIDGYSRAIDARRAILLKNQLEAEGGAVEAYALIAASRGSSGSWAMSDGSLRAADAAAAFSAARAKAKANAQALAFDSGLDESVSSRDKASSALAKLILASGIGPKSASGLERYLASRSKEQRLFPEAAQVAGLLRKSGAAGSREAAAAESYRYADGAARAFVAAKARILALAPAADGPLLRLEADLIAYRAWSAAFYVAAYPGDLASSDHDALSSAIAAFSLLKPEKASSLLEAMALSDGKDQAAAAAGRTLAESWALSSAAGRRELASRCGVSEATMCAFGSVLAPFRQGRAPLARVEALEIMAALGALSSRIASEEADPSAKRGPEPALLLLERPELAAVAKSEARYATLYAETTRRLGSLYAQAAEDACGRLEASTSVERAMEIAVGGKYSSLVVSFADLILPPGESGRRIAFVATASDSQGSSLAMPIKPEAAAMAYASAFAKASGIDSSKAANLSAFLSRYGQWIVAAYDPEGANDRFVDEVFPKGGGPAVLSSLDLELAILGGWQP
jgi:hypothetical protein